MDKRLFAKELWKRAYAINQMQLWVKELLDGVATPDSELHDVLEEIVEHKIGGSCKIKVAGMRWITEENVDAILAKLPEFGIVVNLFDGGMDAQIDLGSFTIPEQEKPVFLHQLELSFEDIVGEFKDD